MGRGRGAYTYLIAGSADFNGYRLTTGDAARVTNEPSLAIRAANISELILVDVPMEFDPVGIWAGRG